MLIRNNQNIKPSFSILWLCQLIASTSWMASVFVYGSFTTGDYLQLIAASAWTISNLISCFKNQFRYPCLNVSCIFCLHQRAVITAYQTFLKHLLKKERRAVSNPPLSKIQTVKFRSYLCRSFICPTRPWSIHPSGCGSSAPQPYP